MTLTTEQWHQRYIQQASWTRSLRTHIFSRIGVNASTRLVDIGCGTGVLERELNSLSSPVQFGLDINEQNLSFAKNIFPYSCYIQGDCLQLPFRGAEFDLTLCHFLLLWIKEPLKALREMVRVTRPGGWVLALAEPDYGGRIDFPSELSKIGVWQKTALINQVANPLMGRELNRLFHQAGLVEIEIGVLGGQWNDQLKEIDHQIEWEIIEDDLSQNENYVEQAEQLKALDKDAWETGARVLYVPTFYAFAKVKG